jgi:hypothetical protein
MRLAKSFFFLGVAAALGLWFFRPVPVASQSGEPDARLAQFRIVVGLTDTESKAWEGSLTVTGGELVSASPWRFSAQDEVSPEGQFKFQTKVGPLENQALAKHPWGMTDWGDASIRRLIPQGLLVRLRGDGARRVKLESGAGTFEFSAADVPFGKTYMALGGNASVEQLPVEYRLSEAGTADDYPALAVTPEGARWVAWLAYKDGADVVMASGAGKLHALTGRGDHHSPAMAAGKGKVWAAWSRNDSGVWHLYARSFDGAAWSAPEKLTAEGGSNIWPRLVSDGAGRVALVWQGFRQDQSVILAREYADGRWSPERRISEGEGNAWAPAAAYGGGKLWVAWDSYATGAYQVYVRAGTGPVTRVTRGEDFSVRPSIAVAPDGRAVVAWEESDALWGKDFAFLCDRRGTVIYKNRRIRVASHDASGWEEIASPMEAAEAGARRFVQQPILATGARGQLYLAFRCRTSAATSRIDYWANNGQWETFLTHLDGARWTPAVRMASSFGRNGMLAALAIQGGKVHVAWPSDARAWPGGRYGEIDVFTAAMPVEGAAARLAGGKAIVAEPVKAVNAHPREAADTRQIRAYRIALGGKQFRILRGDLHRHTELSGDGAGDGSLDDLYRYTLDAAAMDYAHVGDHQMGNDEEYNWWITQKSNDLYFMPQRFVPLYGYERSVWYPNGHRNVVWAERGKPVLKIGQPEAKGAASSGPILYPYLRETGGIATSHSSATDQGTDWRDNDPQLEPVVEIYQGFESNYEHAGAPRSWKKGDATVHQGERPDGYVWNAWAKGYKLGVQSSSDHISTHTSYACLVVEDFSRQGMMDALRKRHTYAATDQIVLDYRIVTADAPPALMGDMISTSSRPKLVVKALGTAPISQVHVIKNNQYVYKASPNAKTAAFEYVDNAATKGESYYYVRVEQSDGQLAWSSPIWVTYR